MRECRGPDLQRFRSRPDIHVLSGAPLTGVWLACAMCKTSARSSLHLGFTLATIVLHLWFICSSLRLHLHFTLIYLLFPQQALPLTGRLEVRFAFDLLPRLDADLIVIGSACDSPVFCSARWASLMRHLCATERHLCFTYASLMLHLCFTHASLMRIRLRSGLALRPLRSGLLAEPGPQRRLRVAGVARRYCGPPCPARQRWTSIQTLTVANLTCGMTLMALIGVAAPTHRALALARNVWACR